MYKLLATSALVAAGLWGTTEAAFAQAKVAPISVVVGGYHEQMFGYGSNKNDRAYAAGFGLPTAAPNKPNRMTQYSDSEIWFGGRTTLANGITIGFDVQLEANTAGDQIDESYLFVDGAFGRIVIGSENSADYIMNYSIPGVGKSWGALESAALAVVIPTGAVTLLDTVQSGKGAGNNGSVLPNGGNDQRRLTYYTPRFFGFGAGLSYTPNVTLAGTQTSFEDINGVTDKRSGRHNAWHGSVNFTNSFPPGIQVNASVGFSYYPKLSNAAPNTANDESVKDFSAGLQVGFMGFLVGGGYRNLDVKRGAEDGYAWGVGATWTGGPWSIGANYLTSKVEGNFATAADDKFRQIMLSAAFTMGPGVDLIGSVFHIKYDSEDNLTVNDNKGVGAMGGIRLSF